MYTSTFSDWFCQAVIDFVLGHRTLSVFSEFLLKLQSSDPRDLIRLSKIRAEAIATSVARVLEEGESLLAGWTMFAPEEMAVKVGDKWEEKVLLLVSRCTIFSVFGGLEWSLLKFDLSASALSFSYADGTSVCRLQELFLLSYVLCPGVW